MAVVIAFNTRRKRLRPPTAARLRLSCLTNELQTLEADRPVAFAAVEQLTYQLARGKKASDSEAKEETEFEGLLAAVKRLPDEYPNAIDPIRQLIERTLER
jgi:hypothetical protein